MQLEGQCNVVEGQIKLIMSLFYNSFQVSLYCLPFPAQTDPAGCQSDHSDDLGAGIGDYVSFCSDPDSGACQAALYGA